MKIKNVTERSASALYSLSVASKELNRVMCSISGSAAGEKYSNSLYYANQQIENAAKELIHILAQDNDVDLA